MKLVRLLVILIFVIPSLYRQDSLETNQKVYYFNNDSLKFDFFEYRRNRACLTEHYSHDFIVDKVGEPISGWVITQKRRYLIARKMFNGVQHGFHLEYKMRKGNLVLNAISIYENDNIFVSFGFDPKTIEKGESLFNSIKAYMVWHIKDEISGLFATWIILKGKSKQRELRFYFKPEYRKVSKFRTISNLDNETIECFISSFNFTQIPKVIAIENLDESLLKLKEPYYSE